MEKVVAVIMSQRARRDILIFDCEIYEYKKTQISFKETKGGLVIKHKKFLLDDESNIVVQEMKDEQPQPQVSHQRSMLPAVAPSQALVQPVTLLITPTSKVLKYVTLDPNPQILAKMKASGLSFGNADKRYPVFRETLHPTKLGITIYTMLDDNNREVNVMDEYFLNADTILKNGFGSLSGPTNGVKEARLSYGEYENMEQPDIRGR